MRMTWLVLLATVLGGCRHDSNPETKETRMSTDAGRPTASPPVIDGAAGPSLQPVARELAITDMRDRAKVRVQVPADWTASEVSVVLRDPSKEAIAGVQFTVVCNENCGDDVIARFPKMLDQSFDNKARPNQNTGDPELDAVRLGIEVLEEGDLPDGKFRVARVTKPAGVRGPIREQVYAVCVRARKGHKAVSAQGWAPLAREKDLGAVVVSACKTFEILQD